MTAEGAEKSEQCHKYFLQYCTFASENSVSNMGAPSNLVTPLAELMLCRMTRMFAVIDEKRSPVAQYFCRRGCPSGYRAELWQLGMAVTVGHLVRKYSFCLCLRQCLTFSCR